MPGVVTTEGKIYGEQSFSNPFAGLCFGVTHLVSWWGIFEIWAASLSMIKTKKKPSWGDIPGVVMQG